jgi:hypothetical protein
VPRRDRSPEPVVAAKAGEDRAVKD